MIDFEKFICNLAENSEFTSKIQDALCRMGYEIKDGEIVNKDYRPVTEDEIPYEPKFKVNDFIVDTKTHEVFKVMQVLNNTYEIIAIDDNSYHYIPHYTVDDNYRKWDISKDAQNGDVLYSDDVIFMFKFIDDTKIRLYCDVYFWKGFQREPVFEICSDNEYFGDVYQAQDIYPATQEQQDLLFKKMAEAGYEWNAEKKELKKIQKPDLDNTNGTIKFEESKVELTEFEEEVKELINSYAIGDITIEGIKIRAQILLNLARKQIVEEIDVNKMVENWRNKLQYKDGGNYTYYRQGIFDTKKKILCLGRT